MDTTFQEFAGPSLRVGSSNTLEVDLIDDKVLPLAPYCLNNNNLQRFLVCTQR